MYTMCQRDKIQEESLYYEHKKHDGSLPLVGVNTSLPKEHAGDIVTEIELIRSTEERRAIRSRTCATASSSTTTRRWQMWAGWRTDHDANLASLQRTARERQTVFAALMEAVKTHSLG